eukprot:CAMPEP_0171720710 /NCGR_PEP_ID=MMETSP0991-20121206/21938_1 /TAXON_ID=483369 /ORGANISM="non described non described, Strain CCMP2098" /LENGTH=589 /DNA_ID=CAMNT_0012312465 /DNA_START=125 /DNA_END=1894 /DNA_ORIENTATION=-
MAILAVPTLLLLLVVGGVTCKQNDEIPGLLINDVGGTDAAVFKGKGAAQIHHTCFSAVCGVSWERPLVDFPVSGGGQHRTLNLETATVSIALGAATPWLRFRSSDNFATAALRYHLAQDSTAGMGCSNLECVVNKTVAAMVECAEGRSAHPERCTVSRQAHAARRMATVENGDCSCGSESSVAGGGDDDRGRATPAPVAAEAAAAEAAWNASLLFGFDFTHRSDADFEARLALLAAPKPRRDRTLLVLAHALHESKEAHALRAALRDASRRSSPRALVVSEDSALHLPVADVVVFDGVFAYTRAKDVALLRSRRPSWQRFLLVSIEPPHPASPVLFDLFATGSPGRADLLLTPATEFEAVRKLLVDDQRSRRRLLLQRKRSEAERDDDEAGSTPAAALGSVVYASAVRELVSPWLLAANSEAKEGARAEMFARKKNESFAGATSVASGVATGVVAFVSSRCVGHRDRWVFALRHFLRHEQRIELHVLGKCLSEENALSEGEGNGGGGGGGGGGGARVRDNKGGRPLEVQEPAYATTMVYKGGLVSEADTTPSEASLAPNEVEFDEDGNPTTKEEGGLDEPPGLPGMADE